MVSAQNDSALRDQRGFVLIMGVAMGSVLVIALWYLINTGDAILMRERMQDAADAVALDTATWHARGMNAVSLLNIVMAVMFMVIIGIRLVELTVVVVLIACHVFTLVFPPAEAACLGLDTGALSAIVEFEIGFGGRVLQAIQIAGWMQAGVAVLAPVEAMTIGADDSESDYVDDRISGVSAVSLSLLPSGIGNLSAMAGSPRLPAALLNGFIGKDRTPEGQQGPSVLANAFRQTVADGLAGTIPSLPVGVDDYGTLCQRSGEMMASGAQIGDIIAILLGKAVEKVTGFKLPVPSGLVNVMADADHLIQLAAGEVLSTDVGKQVFCTPVLDQLEKVLEIAADKVAGGEDVVPDDHKASEEPEVDDDGKKKGKPVWKKLRDKVTGLFVDVPEQLRKLAKKVGEKAEEVKAKAGPSADDLTIANFWSYADQGGAFVHTWSTAAARSRAASGSWSRVRYDAITAEAEFYANCAAPSWRTDGGAQVASLLGEHSCRDDLMWRLAWTARLRRYRSPAVELRHGALDLALTFTDDVTEKLMETMSKHWQEKPENAGKTDDENPVELLKRRWEGGSPSRSISVPGVKSVRDDAIEHLRAQGKHEYDDSLILH